MIAIFLAAAMISLVAILYVYYTMFMTSTSQAWLGWAVLGGAVVIGVLLGLTCTRFARVGATLIAVWGGFVLGMILNEAVLYMYTDEMIFWIVCGASAFVFGVLVFIVYNHAVILCTSLVGSYLFVRGISFYAGGFPNEYLLIKQIKSGMLVSEPLSFYFYLGGILLATIICAIIQYRTLRLMDEYEKHPYERLR